MGILKNKKAELAAFSAIKAAEEGRTVLVLLVNVPKLAVEGQPVSGVAEQVEAVEAAGWRLHSLSARDAGSMVALFRRSHHQP